MAHVVSTKTVEGQEDVEVLYEGRKATVSFERSVSVKPYETAKVSAFVQANVDFAEDSDENVEAALHEAANLAKKVVLTQLGISYAVDEVTRVVIEDLENKLGARVAEGEKPTTPTKRKPAAKSNVTPITRSTKAPASADKGDLWADLFANPGLWFDNREDKRNPKAPDFKAMNKNKNVPADSVLWVDSCPDPAKLEELPF